MCLAGGTLESCCYAFGEYDILGLIDVPDNVTAVSFALTVKATGLIAAGTSVLMTPEEMDESAKSPPSTGLRGSKNVDDFDLQRLRQNTEAYQTKGVLDVVRYPCISSAAHN